MANWVRDVIEADPVRNNWPVLKRARNSIHLRRPDGQIEASFTAKPMHFKNAASGRWEAIDTYLRDIGGGVLSGHGTPAEIATDGTVRLKQGAYSQRTTRVGLYRPGTGNFISKFNVPLGTIQGDELVASGTVWERRLRLTEDGAREELRLTQQPTGLNAQANDWLVLESVI